MDECIDLVALDDIPDNCGVAVEHGERRLLVCRSKGKVHVVDNRCPHQGQPLTGGRVRNGFITCPVHGMRFRLEDGEALGQLTRTPLTMHESRVENGRVLVRG